MDTVNARKLLVVASVVCLLLMLSSLSQAQRIRDPRDLISFEIPVGWSELPAGQIQESFQDLPNPEFRLIGVDQQRTAALLINTSNAADIIPHVRIAVHEIGGLDISEESLQGFEDNLEDSYSQRMGSRFKLLTLKPASFNGLWGVRITGIYRWRTVNIKILQVLLPGSGHLYEITYTAKEREFSSRLDEVEEAIGTVQIVDPPIMLEWLRDWTSGLVLVLMLGVVLGLMLYIVGNRLGRPRLSPSPGGGSATNPFLRKK